MSIQAIECVALTKLTINVEVNSIDHEGITISGDHVTHTLFHGPDRFFSLLSLQSRYRFVLKQVIKRVSLFAVFAILFSF